MYNAIGWDNVCIKIPVQVIDKRHCSCYTKPVFQLDTTYTTNNYHYNADVTNLEIHNKKASTCTTQASIIVIYIFMLIER